MNERKPLTKKEALAYLKESRQKYYFEYTDDLILSFSNGGYQVDLKEKRLDKDMIDWYLRYYAVNLDENNFPQKKTYQLPNKRNITFKF